MFARLVKSNLRADRIAEFSHKFELHIVPILRRAKGFRNAYALVGASGTEAVSLTFWDRKQDAEAYNNTTFSEALKVLSTVFEGTPKIQTYDVTSSTFDEAAAHAPV